MATRLSQTLSANGDSNAIDWWGGQGVLSAQGDFGGGTLTLRFSADDGTTYNDVGSSVTLTAGGAGGFTLPPCKLKATLSGATGPSVAVKIQEV